MSHLEGHDPTDIVEVNKLNLFPGALEDTRTPEEKAKDWKANEVATFGPVNWVEKRFEDIKTFPVRNQDGSGSCVAATSSLMLGIENYLEEEKYIEFSFKDIYDRRSNKPSAGMIGVDALNILRDYGATLNALMPSDNQSEAEIADVNREESDEQIAHIFRSKNYVQLPFDIEKIAWTIESGRKNGVGKPIMTWYAFPLNEWNAVPTVTSGNENIVRHSVTAVDYGILNGVKGLFTQDSWGLHSSTVNGLRFISENYIRNRMIFCAYNIDLSNNWRDGIPTVPKPKYTFTKNLAYGMMNDPDVKALQGILAYEGFFSSNPEHQTGNYFEITARAVEKFQIKYKISPTAPNNVGPKTLEALRIHYS